MFGWLNSSYSVAAVLTLLMGGIIIDRIGTKKSIVHFCGALFPGRVADGVARKLCDDGGRANGAGAGRRIDDRGGHYGVREVVQGKGTEFRVWGEPDDCPAGLGGSGQFADLGEVVLLSARPSRIAELAGATHDCGGAAGLLCLLCSAIYWYLESAAEARYQLGKAGSVDKLEFQGIFRFNPSYWYVVGLCFTFYSAIFPFRTFAIDFLHEQDSGLSGRSACASEAASVIGLQQAGVLNSLLPFSAMIATPLFGLLVDRIGKRALFMMVGSVLLMPVYLMMAYLPAIDYVTFAFPWICAGTTDDRARDAAAGVAHDDGHDGYGVLADSGGDVAFGGLYRRTSRVSARPMR